MKMRTLVPVILVLVLVLVTVGMAQAEEPLRCTIKYTFVGEFDDQGRFVTWAGPISGDIEGTVSWFAGSTPMRYTGQASHYDATWEIVDDEGNVIMAGAGKGSTTIRHGRNSNWRTNEVVTAAYGVYADWVGHQVHESGHFTWKMVGGELVPDQGAGIFRVN